MFKGRLVVRAHKPWRDVVDVLAAVILMGVAGYLIYENGRATGASDCAEASVDRDRLRTLNRYCDSANAALRERVAILEGARQVEQKAYADVDVTLKTLQAEILDLKQELAFYHGIMGSPDKGNGLQIQSFAVEENGGARDYRYRLVLTQSRKNAKVIRGSVRLSVAGVQEGNARQLALSELSPRQVPDLKFRFRNYYKIEGQLVLPQGFVPHQVVVVATANGKRRGRAERTFDWPSASG